MSPRLRRWLGPFADEVVQSSAWLRWRLRNVVLLPAVAWRQPVFRRLVLGLPGVAATSAAAYVVVGQRVDDRATLIANYRVEAARAFGEGQIEEARVRYERLAIVADEAEDIYRLALCHEAMGQTNRTKELLRRLAPEDATVHADAHLRQAKELLALKPPALRRAVGHLLRAVEARPDFAEPRALLGQYYIIAGDKGEASKHLAEGVKSHPELNLPLAKIAADQGDADTAKRFASAAVTFFAPAARSRPGDRDVQFHYVDALYLARRYPEAAESVRAALKRTDDPRLRELAGDIYAAWCTGTDKALTGERLAHIEEGLSLNPDSGPLLLTLAAAAGTDSLPALAAKAALDRRLNARGPVGSAAHLAVAIEAQKRGDAATARRHLERAHELNPVSPVIANNLAWVLATGPTPDLAAALKYVDAALGRNPDEPNLRDTRGQILVKLSRWQEAVRDLDFALARIPANRDTHICLAQAYRALNLTALAEVHEQRAEALRR